MHQDEPMDVDNPNDVSAVVLPRPVPELLPIERHQPVRNVSERSIPELLPIEQHQPVRQVSERSIPNLLPMEQHQSQLDLGRSVQIENVIPVVQAQLQIRMANISPNTSSRRGLPAPFNIRGRRPSQECLKMPSLSE